MLKHINKKKNLSIETLRGIAIILMVLGHVIGNTPYRGLQVSDDSFYRWLYQFTDLFRMPLFTVISGFVYALRPLDTAKVKSFLKGKARRLALPLIFVGSFQYIIQYLVPGTNTKEPLSQIWTILVFPYAQFWFLQAIILVFLSITILEYSKSMNSFKKWLYCFIGAIVLQITFPFKPLVFSFGGFLYLLPCFILGVGIKRFSNEFERNWIPYIFGFFFLITIVLQQASYFDLIHIDIRKEQPVGIIAGLIGNIFIFSIRRENKLLAWLGSYAYGIYLFHVFGQAGSRILLKLFGFTDMNILFVFNLICGLLVPIVIEYFIEKSKVLRLLFLGLK